MPSYQNARLGKVFIKEEADYGVAPTFEATDAFRHNSMALSMSLNRQDSAEKKGTPGLARRFSRHISGGFNLADAYLIPSGTIGVEPEGRALFEHGLGAKSVGSGSSTVEASPSPTTTGATVANGAAFAVGNAVVINCTGGSNPGRYIRHLTGKATHALTWAPALPQAPATGDTVKAGVKYGLANDLAKSICVGQYFPNIAYQIPGCTVDMMRFQFGGNDEARFSASGPGKAREAGQSEPVSFTTLGVPVTGTIGSFFWEGEAMDVLEFSLELRNGVITDNEVYGTDRARGFYRNGRRSVTGSLRVRFTDDTTLRSAAESGTPGSLLIQCGTTEGGIVGIYCPLFDLDIPDTPDGDGVPDLSYTGAALETTGNDEFVLLFG